MKKIIDNIKKIVELIIAIIICYHSIKYVLRILFYKFNVSDAKYDTSKLPVFFSNHSLATIAIIDVSFLLIILIVGNLLMSQFFRNLKNNRKVLLVRNYKTLSWGLNCITISWLLLYSWLFIFWSGYGVFKNPNLYSFVWSIADLFHALTAFFFNYCYLTLEYPKCQKSYSNYRNVSFNNKLLVSGSITILCLTLSIMGRYFQNDFDKIGPMFLSFWVGLSMQLLFGRLNERKLGFHSFIIIPLYVYVLLQITWAALSNIISVGGLIIIYTLALILKVYFYFFIVLLLTKFQKQFENFLSDTIKLQKNKYTI